MRTIKFRGYNAKNKQWLYGFYLQNRGENFVCPNEFADCKSWEDYKVDPLTVGQFTGMFDKNGREIYEDDLVQDDFDHRVFYVSYNEKEACFYYKEAKENADCLEPCMCFYSSKHITVMDTIFGSPISKHPKLKNTTPCSKSKK